MRCRCWNPSLPRGAGTLARLISYHVFFFLNEEDTQVLRSGKPISLSFQSLAPIGSLVPVDLRLEDHPEQGSITKSIFDTFPITYVTG